MLDTETLANATTSLNNVLIEVIKNMARRREESRVETAKQLADAIFALYDEIGRFLWSFPLLTDSQEKLAIIDRRLTETRMLVARLSVKLPRRTRRCLERFLEDCYADMRIWKRRASGAASPDEWQIEPEKDHLNGNLAKSYNAALKSLRAIARF